MLRFVKSLVMCSAVVGGSMFAAAPQAQAGWGISFYNGYPGAYGTYAPYSPYLGGYGGYGGYNVYNSGFGFQTYNTPGSNFRGYAPWGAGYGGYHHHHCR